MHFYDFSFTTLQELGRTLVILVYTDHTFYLVSR